MRNRRRKRDLACQWQRILGGGLKTWLLVDGCSSLLMSCLFDYMQRCIYIYNLRDRGYDMKHFIHDSVGKVDSRSVSTEQGRLFPNNKTTKPAVVHVPRRYFEDKGQPSLYAWFPVEYIRSELQSVESPLVRLFGTPLASAIVLQCDMHVPNSGIHLLFHCTFPLSCSSFPSYFITAADFLPSASSLKHSL